MTDHADTIRRDVQAARDALVDGTPEKYPNARASVRILDAEALLAERQQLQGQLQRVLTMDAAEEIRHASNCRCYDAQPPWKCTCGLDDLRDQRQQAIDALRFIQSVTANSYGASSAIRAASAALLSLGEQECHTSNETDPNGAKQKT